MFASYLEVVSVHGVRERIHVCHFDKLYEGDMGRYGGKCADELLSLLKCWCMTGCPQVSTPPVFSVKERLFTLAKTYN